MRAKVKLYFTNERPRFDQGVQKITRVPLYPLQPHIFTIFRVILFPAWSVKVMK